MSNQSKPERIIDAARHLLDDPDGEPFSLDAVANRAGVARMTVYNQFGSKAGLLEALFDSIAAGSAIERLGDVFNQNDPVAAMDAFVGVFGEFWTASRVVHARLRAASLSDPDLGAAMEQRNERRRRGLNVLVKRIAESRKLPLPKDVTVNALFVLLSLDGFQTLAGSDRTPAQVVPSMRRLVRQILGVD